MAGRRRLRSPSDESCASPGAAQDAGDEGTDLISGMPDSVLSCILSFLDVKAASKARMLSRRWRHLCPESARLCFDLLSDDCIAGDGLHFSRSELMAHPEKFAVWVDMVLGQFNVRKLKEFTVRSNLCFWFNDHLSGWIWEACARDVEEISFCGSRQLDSCTFPLHLLLQSQTYSDLKTCSHLKHLSLQGCFVECFSTLAGPLTSLRRLELSCVRFDNNGTRGFNHISFIAPYLEILKLEACVPVPNIGRLCVELRYLKSLITLNCFPAADIRIINSNITEFFFFGAVKDISFSGLNFLHCLAIISHSLTEEKVSIVLATLPKGVPRLKLLKLGHIPLNCFQFATLSTFKSLKEIHLAVSGSEASSDTRRLLRILEYAPFLEHFNILLHGICEALTTASVREMHKLHSCGAESSVHSRLKKASVKRELGALGTSDLELALSLLKTASSLELIELAGVETEISNEIGALLSLSYPKVEGIFLAPGCHCGDSAHKSV